jgi:hypothetical protein
MDGWSTSLPPATNVHAYCEDVQQQLHDPQLHGNGGLQHGRGMSGSRREYDSPAGAVMVKGGEGVLFQLPVWAPTTHARGTPCHVGVEATLDRESRPISNTQITGVEQCLHLDQNQTRASRDRHADEAGSEFVHLPQPRTALHHGLLFWWFAVNSVVNGTVSLDGVVDGPNCILLSNFCHHLC